jgi:hypothetical protein
MDGIGANPRSPQSALGVDGTIGVLRQRISQSTLGGAARGEEKVQVIGSSMDGMEIGRDGVTLLILLLLHHQHSHPPLLLQRSPQMNQFQRLPRVNLRLLLQLLLQILLQILPEFLLQKLQLLRVHILLILQLNPQRLFLRSL